MDFTVLKPVTLSFVNPGFPVPYLNSGSAGTQWGRMQSWIPAFIGGIPSIICNTYSSRNYLYAYQFTPSGYKMSRIASPATDIVFSSGHISDYLMVFGRAPATQSKGLYWTVINPFFDLNGWIIGATQRNFQRLGMCFPEGSVSCQTVLGNIFPGYEGFINNPRLITNAGAGCPSSNNWGLLNMYPYDPDSSYTAYDGSGSSGIQPSLRAPNVNKLFTGVGGQFVRVAPGITVGLDGPPRSYNYNTCSIYNYGYFMPGPDAENPNCALGAEIRVNKLATIDFQAIKGGASADRALSAITSDGYGKFCVIYGNDAARQGYVVDLINKTILPINGVSGGGATLLCPSLYLYNGFLAQMQPGDPSGNTSISWSTTQVNTSLSFSKPTSGLAQPISQSNIIEQIMAK